MYQFFLNLFSLCQLENTIHQRLNQKVLFPEPLGPVITTCLFLGISRDIFSNIFSHY